MRPCALFLAVVLMLLAAGCGRPKPQASGTPEPVSLPLRVANGAELQAIDPHVTNGVPEYRVQRTLFEGLLLEDPVTRDPAPGAAESWTVSPDGRVWTFRLHQNLRWSNGDPLTAEDFVFSFRRAVHPELAAPYDYLYAMIEGASQLLEGEHQDFSRLGVRALDPLTLEIRLAAPAPHFGRLLSLNAFMPVHRATLEGLGAVSKRGTGWDRPGTFVGNGPFMLESWVTNQHITVRRNPHYRAAAKVVSEQILFTSSQDLIADERAFAAGQVDVVPGVPAIVVDKYRAANSPLLRIDPYMGVYYLPVNTRFGPLADVRVRRALALAINREALTSAVLRGGQTPAYGFVVPGMGGYQPPERFFEESEEEARQLLAEAGFPGGAGFPELEFLFNTHEQHKQVAEALQARWREVLGVRIRLRNAEWKVFLSDRHAGNYQLARGGWIAIAEDPSSFLQLVITGGGNNDVAYANPDFDRLVAEGSAEMDKERRFALFLEAERILMRDMPVIPLFFYTNPTLIAEDVVGWRVNPLDRQDWTAVGRRATPAP